MSGRNLHKVPSADQLSTQSQHSQTEPKEAEDKFGILNLEIQESILLERSPSKPLNPTNRAVVANAEAHLDREQGQQFLQESPIKYGADCIDDRYVFSALQRKKSLKALETPKRHDTAKSSQRSKKKQKSKVMLFMEPPKKSRREPIQSFKTIFADALRAPDEAIV